MITSGCRAFYLHGEFRHPVRPSKQNAVRLGCVPIANESHSTPLADAFQSDLHDAGLNISDKDRPTTLIHWLPPNHRSSPTCLSQNLSNLASSVEARYVSNHALASDGARVLQLKHYLFHVEYPDVVSPDHRRVFSANSAGHRVSKDPMATIMLATVPPLVIAKRISGSFFSFKNRLDRQGSPTPVFAFSIPNVVLCVQKTLGILRLLENASHFIGLKILCSVMGVRVRAPLRLLKTLAFLRFYRVSQIGGLRPPKITTPATTPATPDHHRIGP